MDTTVDTGDLFKIDGKTGQLSVKDNTRLDIETNHTTDRCWGS